MSDLLNIGPIDVDDVDSVAQNFEDARALLTEEESLEKGDVGGHAFHGNRYTGGIGGDEKPQPTHLNVGQVVRVGRAMDSWAKPESLMSTAQYDTLQTAVNDRLEASDSPYDLSGVVEEYGRPSAWEMNAVLRDGGTHEDVEAMDAAFTEGAATLDHDLTVFRGAALEELPAEGDVLHDEAWVSTATRAELAVRAASADYQGTLHSYLNEMPTGRSVVFMIDVPAGSKVLPIGPQYETDPNNELVLARGANFRVEKVLPDAQTGITVVRATYTGSKTSDQSFADDLARYDKNKAATLVPPGTAWRYLWVAKDLVKVS